MAKEKHIDFHTHTMYSDGLQTPEDLIKTARFNGISYLAITDHDNICAHRSAYELGQKWGVEIIPGVEVSTDKYHILGLGIDTKAESMVQFLKMSADAQKRVCEKRIACLQKQGIPITLEKVVNYCPEARLGKMNIWYTMCQDTECREFFRRLGLDEIDYGTYNVYLDKHPEVNDRDTDVFPEEAIKQIHLAGGKAFIAHPFKQVKDMRELDTLLEQNIDGIEIQPNHNGRNEPFREYAQKHNLLLTYGSDWHGGAFDRAMLTWRGENVLNERLAEVLRIT